MNFTLVLEVNLALGTFPNMVISTELVASITISILQHSISYMVKQYKNETQFGNQKPL